MPSPRTPSRRSPGGCTNWTLTYGSKLPSNERVGPAEIATPWSSANWANSWPSPRGSRIHSERPPAAAPLPLGRVCGEQLRRRAPATPRPPALELDDSVVDVVAHQLQRDRLADRGRPHVGDRLQPGEAGFSSGSGADPADPEPAPDDLAQRADDDDRGRLAREGREPGRRGSRLRSASTMSSTTGISSFAGDADISRRVSASRFVPVGLWQVGRQVEQPRGVSGRARRSAPVAGRSSIGSGRALRVAEDERVDESAVGRVLDHHLVVWAQEQADQQRDRLLAAVRDQQLVLARRQAPRD